MYHIFSQKTEKNNVPSYESPSNSESNGIYNINIISIKKFYKTNFAQNRMLSYIFTKNTFKFFLCILFYFYDFAKRFLNFHMKALQILSPTVYIT